MSPLRTRKIQGSRLDVAGALLFTFFVTLHLQVYVRPCEPTPLVLPEARRVRQRVVRVRARVKRMIVVVLNLFRRITTAGNRTAVLLPLQPLDLSLQVPAILADERLGVLHVPP